MWGGDTLLAWTQSPRRDAGIYVAKPDGWSRTPYEEIAWRARNVACELRSRGLGPDSTVALAEDDLAAFVSLFFGCLLADVTVTPLAPRSAFTGNYRRYLGGLSGIAAPDLYLTITGAGDLRDLPGSYRDRVVRADEFWDPPRERTGDFGGGAGGLLQFTSGSTGTPRGVAISSASLAAQIHIIHTWLEWGPDDSVGSWLPLHHDMGLIGLCLAPVCAQSNIWAIRPRDFLVAPERWLESFTYGASITASPPFGYGYVARRARASPGAKYDLSRLRAAVVGAEVLSPAQLIQFGRRFRPAGFRSNAFRPAYGLAEAVLAATGTPIRSEPSGVEGVSAATRTGSEVRGREVSLADLVDDSARSEGILLSSGRPLEGVRVEILGDHGERLGERMVGEVALRTPSLATGYRSAPGGLSHLPTQGDLFVTGDLGFKVGPDLFVLGRLGDAIKARGQLFLAEHLELEIASRLGLRAHRCVVTCDPLLQGPSVTIVLEGMNSAQAAEASRSLRSILGPAAEVRATLVEPGWIPRTSSGKPRRRTVAQRLGEQ